MQTKAQLIYNDVCVLGALGCAIYRWGQDMFMLIFWMFLFVYFLFKQILAHRENYKLNNRLY